jgi:hypothetical protein
MPFVDDMDLEEEVSERLSEYAHPSGNTLNVFGEIDWEKTIWRYLDFTQLLWILENRSLHFTRADYFDDEYEGLIPKGDSIPDEFTETALNDEPFEEMKGNVFINCWHKKEHENMGMWENYADKGVAIRTTLEGLREALKLDIGHGIHIADVEYLDFDEDQMGLEIAVNDNDFFEDTEGAQMIQYRPLKPFGFKRKYYDYEDEIRAITMADTQFPWLSEADQLDVSVFTSSLVGEIVISPLVPEWRQDLIQTVLDRRYNLSKRVSKSDI